MTLPIWTIYDHPSDYPDYFIARKWLVGSKKNEPEATDEVIARATLDEVRDSLPPGLYCIGRKVGDDPVIVEVWL
jgi:hypothetical protein